MTAPPEELTAWLAFTATAASLLGLFFGACYRLMFLPIKRWVDKQERIGSLVEYHLEVNGADKDLPEEEQGKPLRTLQVRMRSDQIKAQQERLEIAEALKRHRIYSNQLVRTLNQERADGGFPVLPEEA